MKRFLRILFLAPVGILIVVILIGFLSGKQESTKKLPRPSIGEPARDFTYPSVDGNEISLSDFYGDKVVVLNIWATWCPSCKEELPTLQKMYDILKGEDLEVLAVSIDTLGEKVVLPFLEKYGLNFPVLLDTSGSIQLLYGTTGVPETFIIDKKGQIAFVEIGASDWTKPEKLALLRSLMEEPDIKEQK